MKKLIALLLAACLMLGLMTTAFAADEKSNDIVILYTNDVHCAVDDNIGYAGLAAYKKEMQAAYNYVALVDCGDSVQGDVIGTLSKGEYLVDIMNEVGYDLLPSATTNLTTPCRSFRSSSTRPSISIFAAT